MEWKKKTIRQIEWLIVFTVLVVALCFKMNVVLQALKYVLGLMKPFIVGMAFAFVINVLMSFLERKIFETKLFRDRKYTKKLKRPVSLLMAVVLIFAIVTVVCLIVIPQLAEAAAKLTIQIQVVIPMIQKWAEDMLQKYPDVLEMVKPYLTMTPDWNGLFEYVSGFFTTGLSALVGDTFSAATQMAGAIVSSVSTFVIGFIFACYILLQKEKLGIQCRKVMKAFIPGRKVQGIDTVASLAYKTFSSFITGQCLEACILGIIVFVVLTVGGFPYALLIAVMVAFLALIPIFGSVISCVLGAFLIVTESPMRALAFIIIFLVIQQIEGNLIYPKVVGSSIGLPPIWVLVAVTLGGSLMGIAGMLLFIPLTSVIYSLFRKVVNDRIERMEVRKE